MSRVIAGFDWDAGNRLKCEKHGVTVAEIEFCFSQPITVLPDEAHSGNEERLRAIARSRSGRYVFIVFTVRTRNTKRTIRPISARYMHAKEIAHYEKENPNL